MVLERKKKKKTDLNVNCKVTPRPPSYFNALIYSNKDQNQWLCCFLICRGSFIHKVSKA